MVELLRIEDIDPTKWNKFVMEAMNGTVFNTVEWAKVWKASFPHASPLFIVLIEKNEIQAAIPMIEIQKFGFKSYYSMPYGDYGGILIKEQRLKIKNQRLVLQEVAKLAKGRWGMIAGYDFYDEAEELVAFGFDKTKSSTHILPLCDDHQVIWSKLAPSKRTSVRHPEKRGIEISLVKNEQDVIECYKMLEDTAKRHNKRTPRLPLKFYINILNEMSKFLRWSIASKGGMKIANAIHFVYKDSIISWDSGSYTSGLQYRPNDALVWDCIKWGCNNGYKYYNFGGSPSTGLVKFKESWGAEPKSYWCYYKRAKFFELLKFLQKGIK